MDYAELTDQIIAWMRAKLQEAGAKGFVVGLSGGVDSAVTAALCKRVAGEEALGVWMPCHSVPEDEERWDLVAPDWLAPDGAEVPFGFRSFAADSGESWPGNDLLDAHGRVILVPAGDEIVAFGIPAPEGWGEEEGEGEGLPVHPQGE